MSKRTKRQTRRSFSVRAETYVRLQRHCAAVGVTATAFCENAINAALNATGMPDVPRAEAVAALRKPEPREVAAPEQYFTF